MASILDDVQQQLRTIARIQQERTRLLATVTVRRRVTVTVNAEGTVVETRFGPDIEDLSYPEIAAAFTEAAQRAAAEVARKGRELMMPLHDQRARLPRLSDLIEGMPDFDMPSAPPVSTAPPSERRGDAEAGRFTDVEAVEPVGERGRGITDSSW
ncbi:YbaB/EbfC family nucleoid-associated protein [Nocardia transvalensis]|nr:YbaB/EbfC family nucleoid-associated protein [Nocardia transvalensis]